MGNTEKIWKKNCPQCGGEQVYSSLGNLNKSIKLNKICRGCMFKSPEYKTKHMENTTKMWMDISKRNDIIQKILKSVDKWKTSAIPTFNSSKYKEKQREIQKKYLITHPEKIQDNREKIKKLWNDKGSVYYSENFRKKLRVARINQIQSLGVVNSNYNPDACKYFDKLNKERGWNLQHALNGGEIRAAGYFLDAYDKNRNIVIEYDEPHHYKYGNILRQKDIIRQQRLITCLNPNNFLRYNTKNNTLYSVINRKDV